MAAPHSRWKAPFAFPFSPDISRPLDGPSTGPGPISIANDIIVDVFVYFLRAIVRFRRLFFFRSLFISISIPFRDQFDIFCMHVLFVKYYRNVTVFQGSMHWLMLSFFCCFVFCRCTRYDKSYEKLASSIKLRFRVCKCKCRSWHSERNVKGHYFPFDFIPLKFRLKTSDTRNALQPTKQWSVYLKN